MIDQELRNALEEVLRARYDNDEFVECSFGMLKTEDNMRTVLGFVEKADELGDEVTHDDLVALVLILREQLDDSGSPHEA